MILPLPIYDVVFTDEVDETGAPNVLNGITAVSLVDKPAIECDFHRFKEQEPVKFFFDDEKREIIGPALIPDKLIYRVLNGNEFYIKFTKEVIEDLAFNFLEKGFINNLTIMHPESEDPLGALENQDKFYNTHNWIETEDYQQAKEYGFDLPLGTWMLGYKILDDDMWSRIKSGELKGFSVEAFLQLK